MDTKITEEHRSKGIQCKSSGTVDKGKCKWYRNTQICVKLFCCKIKSCCDQAIKFSLEGKTGMGNYKIQKIHLSKTAQHIWNSFIYFKIYFKIQ